MSSLSWNVGVNLDTESALGQYQKALDEAVKGSEAAKKKINKMLGGTEETKLEVLIESNTGQQTAQAKQYLSEWDKIAKAIDKAQKVQEGSLSSLRGQLREATQIRDQTVKIVKETDKYGNEVEKINGEWAKQNALVNSISEKMAQAGGGSKGSLSQLQAELKTTTAIRDQINRVQVTTNKYGQTIRRVTPEWDKQNKKVQMLNRKIADASGNWAKMITSRIPGGQNIMNLANGLTQVGFAAAGVVTAFQQIGQAIGPVVQRTKQLQQLDLAFQGFGLTAQQSAQFMDQAKAQAFKYGASLTQLEKGYKRIAPAIMNSGGSMQNVSDAMASLSARSTTLGLNTEQTGRYFEAFAQVMGKGKLQGEELNQQFSELDGALRGQIAAYLEAKHGITDFEKAMENGEITSKLFLEAFNAISEDMKNNLAGAVGEVQARIDSLNVQQLDNISASLNSITLESLGETFGHFGRQMMSVKLMIEQFFANIATTMPGFQKLVQGVMGVIGGTIQVTVVGIIGLLKALFMAIEFVINGWVLLGQAVKQFIEMIPGGKQLLEGLAKGFNGMVKGLQDFTDGWLKVGDAALKGEQDLSQVDGRILVLRNQFQEGKIDAEELAEGLSRISDEAAKEIMLDEYNKLGEKIEDLKQKVKEATQVQEGAQSVFDAEKEKLESLKLGVKNYFDGKKDALNAEKEAVKNRYDREIEMIKRAQDAMQIRHDAEMSALQARNAEAQRGIQAEIDALGGKTPAEEKLAQLRKQEIMDKLKSGDLSEKEKLQLQAQLERMQRQKQIEEAQLRLKAAKENAAKTEAALAEKQKQEVEEMKQAEKELQQQKKAALDEIKEKQKALEAQQDRINKLFEASKNAVDLTGKSIEEITTAVRDQVSSYEDAKTALEDAKNNTEGFKTALQQAKDDAADLKKQMTGVANEAARAARALNAQAAAQQNANAAKNSAPKTSSGSGGGAPQVPSYGGGGMINGLWTGGPTRGGQSYIVNELGKEGFVSASGQVSQINAPAFGKWKAPSSGTVIPAHVWASLKAEGMGSAVSQTKIPGASGTNAMAAAVRALAGQKGGDTVTNNLQITTDNVDKTVQQSLVSLRRTKRARYY